MVPGKVSLYRGPQVLQGLSDTAMQADILLAVAGQDPAENRDVEKLLGKLALAAKFILNKESSAYLSIGASVYLHKAAFGGGYVRITWPF